MYYFGGRPHKQYFVISRCVAGIVGETGKRERAFGQDATHGDPDRATASFFLKVRIPGSQDLLFASLTEAHGANRFSRALGIQARPILFLLLSVAKSTESEAKISPSK